MIKLFRNIRQKLLAEGKTTNYLKYAIGEIVLVVIGILIALQINNWNIKRLDREKENKYLHEISNNLKSDVLKIQEVLDFNQKKDSMILECFRDLDIKSTISVPQIFGPRLDILGSYDYFYPNDLGFQNLISAENIGLIENDSVRNQILEYYNFDFKNGVQQRAEELTRKFVDYLLPRITTKESFFNRYGIEFELPTNNEIHLKNDQQLMSNLRLMQVVALYQNDLLTEKKEEIEKLIAKIQNEFKLSP